MRFLIKEGFQNNYSQIEYNAVISNKKCLKCGVCIKRCPMKAITKE
ncbi:4Fe-4S binding protein [Clostridium cylindrosporum]